MILTNSKSLKEHAKVFLFNQKIKCVEWIIFIPLTVIIEIAKWQIDAENLGLLFQSEQWCQLEPRFSLGSEAVLVLVTQGTSSIIASGSGTQNARDLPFWLL